MMFTNLSMPQAMLTAVAVIGATGHVLPTQAASLGIASDYNAFIFSDVVNMLGSDLSQAADLTIDAPSTATIVVNIDGSTLSLGNFDFFGNQGSKVLYNFYQANQITTNGLGIQGSVLAPKATVNLNNGQIKGTLIANGLQGTGELNVDRFTGDIPDPQPNPRKVPEPSALAALCLLALGLSRQVRQRQKAQVIQDKVAKS